MRNSVPAGSHERRVDLLNKSLAVAAVDLMSARAADAHEAAAERISKLRRELGEVLLDRDKLERPWLYGKGRERPALPPRPAAAHAAPTAPRDTLQRRIDLCASKRSRAERLLFEARTADEHEARLADVRRLERAHGALLLARDRRLRPAIYAKPARLPS